MLHHITLHLARSKEFPKGSKRHRYEITAPLDHKGFLDREEWASKRAFCRFRRFWPNAADRQGVLIYRSGGAAGATWMIDYDQNHPGKEESGYRFNQHRIAAGEYVTIQDEDEKLSTFEVVTVRPAERFARPEVADMKRAVLLGVVLMWSLAPAPVLAQEGRAQRGLTFARVNCSQCHAIGIVGDSPLTEAPPFRILHTRYPVENLAEAFAEGFTTGHPSMPEFQLDVAQINDLIAYLKSIER